VVVNVDSIIKSGGKVDLKIESAGLKVERGRLPEKVIISCTSFKGFPLFLALFCVLRVSVGTSAFHSVLISPGTRNT